jgi:hypothetical protein
MLTKPQSASRVQETRARMEDLLMRITAKDRAYIEKHLTACDSARDPAHGEAWRRLAGLLGQLVALPPRMSGPQALTFFIPDGKYRKQVFTLEDRGDGVMVVYLPDVMNKALREKLLAKSGEEFTLPGSHEPFAQVIDGNVPELPNYIKPMLGWNRKAIKLSVHVDGSGHDQLHAAEELCALAAKDWAVPVQ